MPGAFDLPAIPAQHTEFQMAGAFGNQPDCLTDIIAKLD